MSDVRSGKCDVRKGCLILGVVHRCDVRKGCLILGVVGVM